MYDHFTWQTIYLASITAYSGNYSIWQTVVGRPKDPNGALRKSIFESKFTSRLEYWYPPEDATSWQRSWRGDRRQGWWTQWALHRSRHAPALGKVVFKQIKLISALGKAHFEAIWKAVKIYLGLPWLSPGSAGWHRRRGRSWHAPPGCPSWFLVQNKLEIDHRRLVDCLKDLYLLSIVFLLLTSAIFP